MASSDPTIADADAQSGDHQDRDHEADVDADEWQRLPDSWFDVANSRGVRGDGEHLYLATAARYDASAHEVVVKFVSQIGDAAVYRRWPAGYGEGGVVPAMFVEHERGPQAFPLVLSLPTGTDEDGVRKTDDDRTVLRQEYPAVVTREVSEEGL